MEISSFLSTNPQGTECCVAPANAWVRDTLDEEGTEELAAGFAALFQLMMAPASQVSDKAAADSTPTSAVEAPSSGTPGVQPSGAAPAQSLPVGAAPAGPLGDSFPTLSAAAPVDAGAPAAPFVATQGTEETPATEAVMNPTTPAVTESDPGTPSPPLRADLFLSERQGEPTAALSVLPESATMAVSTNPANPDQDAISSSTPDVVTPVTARTADVVRGAAPKSDTAAPSVAASDSAPPAPSLATPRQDVGASRSAAAARPSAGRPVVNDSPATASQPTGPEAKATPQTDSPSFDAAAEWTPETTAEGIEVEPPREDRPFDEREPDSWLDSLTGAGSDGTLTIQELAAWQAFGREQGFEQSRQETSNDTPQAGPIRKTTDGASRVSDGLAAAVPQTAAREAAAAVPAVIAHEALPSFAVEEIVSHVRTDESDGVSRVEAQIDPPELGRMWIEITKSAEGIKAHLTVEDPAVWNLLETAATEMRQSLQDSGVPMTGLTLSLGRDGGSSPSGGHAGDPNGESRRDEDSYATVTGAAQRRARPKRQVDTIV
ncbi:flagellar hook-length control protein FliK [Planctomyces sp. SH-PL14]|uniref:flagellar hook-length control protein FliK n=1 Tax=Planctomyces sp. SH-PL14 TaxID=1632864 RepID=UPI00078B23C9|nr:flagellar hook-length control protein FliK [Planctomyces sp. SH-PL14]AMV22756.1 Flagellar hook-length control protein FliK [Planctomyces sp. SH-PL14]